MWDVITFALGPQNILIYMDPFVTDWTILLKAMDDILFASFITPIAISYVISIH